MRSSGRRYTLPRAQHHKRATAGTPGYSGKEHDPLEAWGPHMSHEYILTDDDAAPAGATHAQDVLELSMLTMPQPGDPIVDISWEKSPLDL
jgi:hypothetical protein